jgi:hypothetical protein
MPIRLTKIDELTLSDHYRLNGTDECYFVGEYTARAGFNYSATNDLISNLKKSMDRKGRPEWRYKVWAISRAVDQLREVLPPEILTGATFVPVPPSYAKTDPLYDGRIVQILHRLGDEVDVRELVIQTDSYDASHGMEVRLGPDELYALYRIAEELVNPEPTSLVVVDDVLTTGAHFTAMKRILNERFPDVPLIGVFVARRVPERLIPAVMPTGAASGQ